MSIWRGSYEQSGLVGIINLLYNKAMKTTPIEIRDKREQEWCWMNNSFVDFYGELVGVHGVAVYSVLCRHANNDTQQCFPSMDTIGRKAGIRSRKTVSKSIEILEKYHIIEVEKAQGTDGKRLNNIYRLNNPKAWKKVSEKVKQIEDDGLEEFERDMPEEAHKPVDAVVILPAWLNPGVWAQWIAFRKEIKKKLTPISIKQQIAFLEMHKSDHVDIIRNSIQNGWQGLFPLKSGKFKDVKKVEAKEGKYAAFNK